jgi:hypothetical protein
VIGIEGLVNASAIMNHGKGQDEFPVEVKVWPEQGQVQPDRCNRPPVTLAMQ